MATPQHIDYLLKKYLDNTNTPQEYDELLAYFDTLADDAEAEKLLYEAISSIDTDPAVPAERLERVTDNAFHSLQERLQRSQKSILRRWMPYVAAASVFLFVFVGVYWYANRTEQSPSPVLTSAYGDDVPPGGNRAYITLSDGRSIALDSTQTTLVSNQGKHVYTDGEELAVTSGSEFAIVSTPVGGSYQVVLPDGTKAWLNAQSSLRYPMLFSETTREVETTGEVYFEVISDKDKPFYIYSAGQKIQVLGTAFNVRSYHANTITTLIHGKIALTNSHTQQQVVLRPNEQSNVSITRTKVMSVDASDFVAWKDGFIVNRDADIIQACQELERWYGVRFIFPVGFKNNERAVISLDRRSVLSTILSSLEDTYRVKFLTQGKEVHIR